MLDAMREREREPPIQSAPANKKWEVRACEREWENEEKKKVQTVFDQ